MGIGYTTLQSFPGIIAGGIAIGVLAGVFKVAGVFETPKAPAKPDCAPIQVEGEKMARWNDSPECALTRK